jgi:MYXO-CTERM domain-containing protein
MKSFNSVFVGVALAPLLVASAIVPASAGTFVPMILVDMDPAAPGIQSARSVLVGDTFTVDIVGQFLETERPFNGAVAQIYFNSDLTALPVLAPMAPTIPVAGVLVGEGRTDYAIDAFSGLPVLAGGSLGFSPVLGPPLSGYLSVTPAAGYYAPPPSFPFFSGPIVSILSMEFTASAEGTSMLLPDGYMGEAPSPLESLGAEALPTNSILTNMGQPVFAEVFGGMVTVAVPEPGSAMLGLVSALLIGARRRRAQRFLGPGGPKW